jgi:arylsulfatase A-like enzyme
MKKPNILVFMADHHRWDMVSPYKRAITPNLDKLAEKGLTFDCFTVDKGNRFLY